MSTSIAVITADIRKSFVREHYRRLPDGRMVRVTAHDANRKRRLESRDDHTGILFGENVGGEHKEADSHPVRQEFPEECARNPEDCTVDMFTNKTRRDERLGKAAILVSGDLLLKATTTKVIMVPAYTRNGKVVPSHAKTVHYDPDKAHADILSGGGSHSQKQAHKKLHAALPGFKNLHPDEQLAHILSSATNIQNKASASAAVSGYKKSILAGKVPSGSEIKAWGNLDPAKQMDVVGELAKKVDGGMTAVMKLHNAAVDKFGGPVVDPGEPSITDAEVPAPSTPEEAAAIEADFKQQAADFVDAKWGWLGGMPAEAVEPGLKGAASSSGMPYEHLLSAYKVKQEAQKPAFSPDPNIHDWYSALEDGHVPSISAMAGTMHVTPEHLGEAMADLKGKLGGDKLFNLLHEAKAEWDKEEGHKAAAAAFATGAHYQKEAHKKLTTEHGDDWHKFTGKEQHRMLQAKYQELQGAATASAKVSGWKKKMMAGKAPSLSEAQAYMDLPSDKQKKFYLEVVEKIGADKAMMLHAGALGKISGAKQASKPEPAVIVMADPTYGNGGSKVTNVKLGQHTYSRIDGVWKNDSTGQEMGLNKWKAVALNMLSGIQFDPSQIDEAYKDMALTAIADLDHSKFSVGQAIGVLYPDLPEGAIKEHDGKTYQLKDGRWHLMGNDEPVAPAQHKYAWDALKGWKGNQSVIAGHAKEWLAANPDKKDELSSALVDLGHYEVAKQMGIYKPPSLAGDLSPGVQSVVDMAESLDKPKTKKAPVMVAMANFTNTTPGHNKFWACGVHGKQLITMYGKLGTMGQKTIKTFPTEVAALDAAMKLKHEKTAKGYVHKGSAMNTVELDVPDSKPKSAPDGSVKHLVAALEEGEPIPSNELKAYTNAAKESATNIAAVHGVDPLKALNSIMSPYGYIEGTGPKEGDTKVINGTTYVLKNGRWHKQGDDAAAVLLAGAKKADAKQTKAEQKAAALKAAIEAVTVPDFSADTNTKWAKSYEEAAKAIKASLLAGDGFTKYVTTQKGGLKFLAHVPGIGKLKDIHAASPYVRRQLMFKFLTDLKAAIAANNGGKIAPSVIATTEPVKAAAPTPAAPTPAASAVAPKPAVIFHANKTGITAMDGWTQVGPQKGSNPGGTYKDKNGQEWYVKFPQTEDHCKNELLASKLYKAAGVEVPMLKLVSHGGKVGIASKVVPGVSKVGADIKNAPGALEGFAADAWLGNYDSVGTGYDNLLKTKEGKAIRIDVGGSLLYRAQGAKKTDFGDEVAEIDGMRDKAKNSYGAAVFSGISKSKLDESVASVLEIPDDVIGQIVGKFGPGDDAAKKALAAKLVARKADLAKKFPSAYLIANPPMPDPRKLPIDASKLPKLPNFLNWNGQGKGLSGNEKVNEANQKAVQEIYDAAMKGNYVAIKSLKYHVVDKTTGAVSLGGMFADHPSQHVRDFYSTVIDYMGIIANPAAKKQKVWDIGEYSSLDELLDNVKPHLYGVSVGDVPANQRLGFWISLGQAGEPKSYVPASVDYVSAKDKNAGAASTKKMPAELRKWMAAVKGSGAHNQPYRDGKEIDNQGQKTRTVLAQAYEHAVEFAAGTRITKDINFKDEMFKQIMSLEPGHIFQNPGSMCCSLKKDWHWGGDVKLHIIYAEGAKALYNIGVGSFDGEGEITTIPGQRFMLVDYPKDNPKMKRGKEITLLMLPPDATYVENIKPKA